MTEIDARLNTGELAVRLVLQTERSYGTILDVEFAPHVTVNGSPDGFREFARDLLELVDMVAPQPGDVFEDIPPHDGLTPFNVGDTVRCVKGFEWSRAQGYGPRIQVGDERTIESLNDNGTLSCYAPDGEYECWNLDRFEAIQPGPKDAA